MADNEEDIGYVPQIGPYYPAGFPQIFANIINFDLSNPHDNDPPHPKVFEAMLDRTAMRDYFAWFLSQDLDEVLTDYEANAGASLPTKMGEFNLLSRYRSQRDRDRMKTVGTHPLSGREYQEALKFLHENPALQNAFLLIEVGIIGYWDSMRQYLMHNEDVRDSKAMHGSLFQKCKNGIDALGNGIFTKALREEFLPIIALAVKKNGTDNLPLSISKGLRDALRGRIAFASASEGGEIHCPFKGAIGHLLNTPFIQQNGYYLVGDGDTHAGLVIAALHKLGAKDNDLSTALRATHT